MKCINQLLLRLALVAVCLNIVWANPSLDEDWKNYKKKFGKTYGYDKELKRRKQFEDKLGAIKKHNEAADRGEVTFHMGVNHLTDWSEEELQTLGGYRPIARNMTLRQPSLHNAANRQLPYSVDWRGDPCIAPVRDQQSCSACYAFAATAALEFPICKALGYLKPLSEQHLIDCSGQNGCTSGRYEATWDFTISRPGQATSIAYPYIGAKGTCRSVSVNPYDRPTNWYYIPTEDDMAYEVAAYGPIAVGFQALQSFYSYKSGVYMDANCPSTCQQANHAFTLVGYGVENGNPYWLMRNSWTTSWGQLGYGKILRGRNMCNIACWAARVFV